MTDLFSWLVAVQTDIRQGVADQVAAFAAGGDWLALLGAMPLAILFGMAHALTPGHNKLVLASFVVGERLGLLKALGTSMLLSATHIGSAVVVGLGANWLVQRTITQAGRAPLLETISQTILVGIALWMILRAIWPAKGHPHHGLFAIAAGLIPCPLTLFTVVMASSLGAPEAGLFFALAMLIGVGSVLGGVGLAAFFGAERLGDLLRQSVLASRVILGLTGVVLLGVASGPLLKALL
ncbi:MULTISPECIES: ABC transporter permease [Devosia]|uniref:HoxN/HupN/NixA family nickel/cobalt transporter n=1 Tax=Devosia TaxID=46913 RepID=UPI0013001B94|nr:MULTISPECIES: ABC transporter permease [Devosia]